MKKLPLFVIFGFVCVSGVFAERIWGAELEFLKNVRTDEEFSDAAKNWDIVVGNGGWRVTSLSNDLFQAVSRELSRWNKSVGNLFMFGCYTHTGAGYDVMIRITKVNGDGSCSYTWYAWRRIDI